MVLPYHHSFKLLQFPQGTKGLRLSPDVSETQSAWELGRTHTASLALIQSHGIPEDPKGA